MNQILFVPDDYKKNNINIIKKCMNFGVQLKRKRLFIFPLVFSLAIGISSYKIYGMVSNFQEIQNNNYIQVGQESIQSNSVETIQLTTENNIDINSKTSSSTENKENTNNIKEETKPNINIEEKVQTTNKSNKIKSSYKASNGKTYNIIANLNIPSLGIEYPILSSTSDSLLKISLNKYWGANPNEVGNMCVVGHNYEDTRFFGKLDKIKNGAIVKITDLSGKTLDYEVYDKYVVGPYNTDCTSQLTNGKTEITLITCYKNGTKRFVVKARAKI